MNFVNETRLLLGLSPSEFADLMGLSYLEMSDIFKDIKTPPDKLIRGCKIIRKIFLYKNDTLRVSNNNSNKYNKQPEFGQKEVHMNTDKNQTENSNRKTFPVYNQKMAGYLMMQGFVLVGIAPNDKYKGRNVFFFWDSPQIKETMKTYLDSIKKE